MTRVKLVFDDEKAVEHFRSKLLYLAIALECDMPILESSLMAMLRAQRHVTLFTFCDKLYKNNDIVQHCEQSFYGCGDRKIRRMIQDGHELIREEMHPETDYGIRQKYRYKLRPVPNQYVYLRLEHSTNEAYALSPDKLILHWATIFHKNYALIWSLEHSCQQNLRRCACLLESVSVTKLYRPVEKVFWASFEVPVYPAGTEIQLFSPKFVEFINKIQDQFMNSDPKLSNIDNIPMRSIRKEPNCVRKFNFKND